MKALTVCQPYARLIVEGTKRVENRSWPTRYRGPLLIHAGKSRRWLDTYDGPVPAGLVFGAILGIVELVACLHWDGYKITKLPQGYHWIAMHEFASGPYCWVLADAVRFETPIPWRGAQGLWTVSTAVISEQLPVSSNGDGPEHGDTESTENGRGKP